MLERVTHVAVLGANPINPLAVRIGFRLRLVQRLLTRAVDFLDALAFLLGFLLGQLAFPTHFPGNDRVRFLRIPYLSSSSKYLSVRASHSFRNFS
jgi:hypothetical protein